MADLPSEEQRNAVSVSAAPYYIRVDVPIGLSSPETRTAESAQPGVAGCAVFAGTALADLGVSPDDPVNVQVRIWFSPGVADDARLVFDRFAEAFAILPLVADFLKEPRTTALAQPSPAAEAQRNLVGGPFDTEHALTVAMNRYLKRQTGREQGDSK